MADVFISYKREERDAVQIIADTLGDLKVDVWFDRRLTVGGGFDEEIARDARVYAPGPAPAMSCSVRNGLRRSR